jgi:hypothetical protein
VRSSNGTTLVLRSIHGSLSGPDSIRQVHLHIPITTSDKVVFCLGDERSELRRGARVA